MVFDKQSFSLYGATKEEALEFIQTEAAAGRFLSPMAVRALAEVFSPGRKGRKRKPHDWIFVAKVGTFRALYDSGIVSRRRGDDWLSLAEKSLAASTDTIGRAIKGAAIIYQDAYIKTVFRLWAAGIINSPSIKITVPEDRIEPAILWLEMFEDIPREKASELRCYFGINLPQK